MLMICRIISLFRLTFSAYDFKIEAYNDIYLFYLLTTFLPYWLHLGVFEIRCVIPIFLFLKYISLYASILKSYAEKVSRNREIILQIINIVVLLGQQNIPFHGHTWNKETKSEDGKCDTNIPFFKLFFFPFHKS
jgi:hypothetical protein